MMAKMLKPNGQCVHRMTFRALTENEIQDQEDVKARKLVDEEIKRRLLGPSSEPRPRLVGSFLDS
jgi:hypothetical protein